MDFLKVVVSQRYKRAVLYFLCFRNVRRVDSNLFVTCLFDYSATHLPLVLYHQVSNFLLVMEAPMLQKQLISVSSGATTYGRSLSILTTEPLFSISSIYLSCLLLPLHSHGVVNYLLFVHFQSPGQHNCSTCLSQLHVAYHHGISPLIAHSIPLEWNSKLMQTALLSNLFQNDPIDHLNNNYQFNSID